MSNIYRALLGLLPGRPLMVGTITSITGGVATIALPGGGTMQARGDGAVSDLVFFRDGVIEGTAPALPIEVIDV